MCENVAMPRVRLWVAPGGVGWPGGAIQLLMMLVCERKETEYDC